jgi:hypothetical protein
MRAPLPPRYWRKVVTAAAGIALTFAATGWSAAAGAIALSVALLLLVESFGRDCLWLFRRRPVHAESRSVLSKQARNAPQSLSKTGAALHSRGLPAIKQEI